MLGQTVLHIAVVLSSGKDEGEGDRVRMGVIR